MQQAFVRKVFRQGAGQGANDVVAPVLAELHVDDPDLENIARPCALDGDRSGQNMAGQYRLAFAMQFRQFGQNLKVGLRHDIGTARHALDRHLIARFYLADRRQRSTRDYRKRQ